MTNREFRNTLSKATAGDVEALADIIELYMPLINSYSYVAGKFDADLRQTILLHILENISRSEV